MSLCRAIIVIACAACFGLADARCDESPVARSDAVDNHSLGFDTGTLRGHLRFGHGKFPGVGRCIFTPADVALTNDAPPNSLLMPEWILKPKGPRDGRLWTLARKLDAHPIPQGVRFVYPDGKLKRQGLRCRLEYRIVEDLIHLDGWIEATRPHTNLELLFASYLPNRFDATYLPEKTAEGTVWRRIPRGDPWKSSYMVASSPETRTWRRDGRISDATELDWKQAYFPEVTFAKPILVAMEQKSGVAAVHFVDQNCTSLLGQPHDHDTAHDFTWGWSTLEPGRKIHARAALWITVLTGSHIERMQQAANKYEDLQRLWAK